MNRPKPEVGQHIHGWIMNKPSIGRVVTYIVGDHEAKDTLGWWPRGPNGHRDHPAIITAVWSDTCVNLQVLFDANPIEVRTSVVQMPELPEGVALAPENSWWKWPARAPSEPQPVAVAVAVAPVHRDAA